MKQVDRHSWYALFALPCPNPECRERKMYLVEGGVQGELSCNCCSGLWKVVIVPVGTHKWNVGLVEA